ncbi:glycosyltransferase family 4 protein [Flavobacterium sp.]|uniref:glycosyltransferase family 4 protein n=1 Tax=Flavobacterium sp. TaxID=239 RepID=UPI003750C12F
MSNNLSITIITANYYPEDSAIGLYTTQLAKFLFSKGFTIKIITGFPSYPQWKIYEAYQKHNKFIVENIDGIEIIRYKQFVPKKVNFKGRVLMMIDLFYGTFRNLKKIKQTNLVICIVPFTVSILPALRLSKKKKSKLWIHIQDFEFDLALDSGILKNNNLFLNFFEKCITSFEKKMLNSADITSSISFSMLKKIKEKSNQQNPYYFPNWVSSEKINPKLSSNHSIIDNSKFTLLYSGNIGEKQDWEFLEKLCFLINNENNIEIVIVGNGGYASNLKQKLNSFKFVKFYEPVPYEELNNLLCSADIHFLFQKINVIDTIMPSKILGMMASAKPSIITGNINSEVATIINQSNGGFYYSNNDVLEVFNVILNLKNNIEICMETGKKAREFILNKFSEEKILNSVYDKINEIILK